jgi:hypothetical protein
MSKDTFYFSHDYNARADDKIKCLVRKHGILGYGIFWAIIEDLYNNANAMRTDYDGIAYDLRTDCDTIKSIINDFDLFIIEDGFFGSKSIENRLIQRNCKSEKARESAFKRWGKVKPDANAMRTQCERNAIKERKGKERKEKKNKEVIYPSSLEVENYFFENGYKMEAGKKAFNYYSTGNWTDSKGNKVRNWKQKMQAIWFKDENKINDKKPESVMCR